VEIPQRGRQVRRIERLGKRCRTPLLCGEARRVAPSHHPAHLQQSGVDARAGQRDVQALQVRAGGSRGRSDVGQLRVRHRRADRQSEEDRAATSLEHARQHRPDQCRRGPQQQVERELERLAVAVPHVDVPVHPLRTGRRVLQHIDGPEPARDRRHQIRERGPVADVGGEGGRLDAVARQLGGQRLQPPAGPGDQGDPESLSPEAAGHGSAQPGSGPDHRDGSAHDSSDQVDESVKLAPT
jgi:hypothetical protein